MIAAPVTVKLSDGQSGRGCACLQVWAKAYADEYARTRPGRRIVVAQWCYSAGAVSASGGTHDGGGVWDIVVQSTDGTPVNAADWLAADDLAEEMGAVSYWRDSRDGMIEHLHQILIGCAHAAASALSQIESWRARRNALRNNAPDRDQTRPATIRTWSQGIIIHLTEGDLTMAQIDQIMAVLKTHSEQLDYLTRVSIRTQQIANEDKAIDAVTQARVNETLAISRVTQSRVNDLTTKADQ